MNGLFVLQDHNTYLNTRSIQTPATIGSGIYMITLSYNGQHMTKKLLNN
ncbi:MAG: hypothetical protein HRT68_04235 [Flavobacteriaceae bacterium]|nr:hypothetical protein [Flavobacteriaceae bacterium]